MAKTALQHVECLLEPSKSSVSQVLQQLILNPVKADPCALQWAFHTAVSGRRQPMLQGAAARLWLSLAMHATAVLTQYSSKQSNVAL